MKIKERMTMSERKELKEEALDKVIGGFIYNPNTKILSATKGGKIYH